MPSTVIFCSQGLQALTWVTVKPAPRDFIENFIGASDFWGNKIRTHFKKTAPNQTAFVDTFKAMIKGLMDYVREHHTTGLSWNARVSHPLTTGPTNPQTHPPASHHTHYVSLPGGGH
jgi:lysophospholipase L1-like esterase